MLCQCLSDEFLMLVKCTKNCKGTVSNRKMSSTMQGAASLVVRASSQNSNPSQTVEQFKGHVWLSFMAQLPLCLGQPP